jgi:LPXTG-site transpeptidase (sortase) family protein
VASPQPSRGRARRRWALALVAFALAVVVVAAARGPGGSETDTGAGLGAAVGRAETPRPSLEVVPPTTLRPAGLPLPDALPADPYAPTPELTAGTIEIPALGIAGPLHVGMTLTAIDRGPSWWPNTAMPGEWGNVVVAGHRTTHSKPFARLNELEPGDQVIFTTDAGRFVYEVRGVIVVPGEWIDIAAQDWAHTATLFACHPPGSDRERIVAKLRLLDDDGVPVDDDADLPPLDAEAQRTEHTLIVRTPSGDQPAGSDPFAGSGG